MKQIKFLFIIVIFAAVLSFGNPSVISASSGIDISTGTALSLLIVKG